MNFLRLVALVAMISTGTSQLVLAKEVSATQNRASGRDIYRIEIRNLGQFQMFPTGDVNSDGELHSILIELSEPRRTRDRQRHAITERAPLLHNMTTGSAAGSGYLTIEDLDIVGFQRRSASDFDLWIHSAYRNYREGAQLGFTITTVATELDCSGQRVCGRQTQGRLIYSFAFPELRNVPPRHCGPENTFRLNVPAGSRAYVAPSDHLLGPVSLEVTRSDGRGSPVLGQAIGPFASLTAAEICIARTW
ncbi:hypothetical protein [Aliiroseovarius subalbicans]|uniref:hypothetical protein n=1 Tax=Aliiroseovarius subalbicans TaxID=2925840 RepID=UPI001F570CF1|nr:hypothetical protein [Aliiroseovarius subalbicans]MCI2398537.1 hypothetical protein [Aliiroseovarius subalbicans]